MAESLKMLTGKAVPQVGLGTWQSKPGEVEQAVQTAIELGYRHIDTAQNYQNEGEIGNALEELIKQGEIKRDDIFITTKLSGASMIPERVREQTEISLKKLKTDYIDLLLIHFPVCLSDDRLDENPPLYNPRYKSGVAKTMYVDPLDTWREMELLVDEGLVKAIGLSNFNKSQVQRMWDEARIKPSSLQCECHIWFPQYELVDFCKEKGMTFTAYGPIGSPGRPRAEDKPRLLDDPVVNSLAKKHNKTAAQILLRYLIQRGIVVLPKSVSRKRLAENIQLFDFILSEDDIMELKTISKCERLFKFDSWGKPAFLHPFFPWPEDVVGDYKPGTLRY